MSDYTATLGELMDIMGGRENFERLALADYPIFDEEYRPHLNDMLIEHYLMREVGDETGYGFCRQLRNKMRECAPIFNGLYHSCKMTYDPLSTMGYEIVSQADGTTKSTSDDTARAVSDSVNKNMAQTRNLEFPNTRLVDSRDYATSGANTKGETDAHTTADNIQKTLQDGSSSSTTRSTGSGYQGDPNQLLAEYRQNLISADMEVIRMVEPCFMQIWQSGDSFMPYSPYDTIFFGGWYGILR